MWAISVFLEAFLGVDGYLFPVSSHGLPLCLCLCPDLFSLIVSYLLLIESYKDTSYVG